MSQIDLGRARAAAAATASEIRGAGPGMVVGVVTAHGLVACQASGYAALEYRVPASDSTLFYAASLSKEFTAACVLLAADRGALSLGSRLADWVPELPSWANDVEISHLLWHSSGLPEYLHLVQESGRSPDDVLSEELILRLLSSSRALAFVPGSQCVYCNTGYWLLGLVLQRATKVTLRAFADRHVFQPAEMRSSLYHDDRWEVIPDLAEGYAPLDGGGFRRWRTCFEQVGDGGLLTSMCDLARWESLLLTEGSAWSELAARLAEPHPLADGSVPDWRAGLLAGEHAGVPVVMAGGTGFGYRAFSVRVPSQGVAVIVLSNLVTTDVRGIGFSVLDQVVERG